MRQLFLLVLIALIPSMGLADESVTSEPTSLQRIAQLETRVAQLEDLIRPLLIDYEIKTRRAQNKQLAKVRMRQDVDTYTLAQRKEIEKLYQAANRNFRGADAKANLLKVVADYPKANRSGCALVYLAQTSKGDPQINYLKLAIENYSDCFYGNGVQVGAYARLLLAVRWVNDGNQQKAAKLLDELAKQYPRSLDHKGQPLEYSVTQLRKRVTAMAVEPVKK
ncbi:MAG: hypothetical protein JKX85_15195 [Phycisphaeraceae bacterium]|nr:hypothetical protein [Phycisphaeraceae bacterium]